jgi:hypothetical protein
MENWNDAPNQASSRRTSAIGGEADMPRPPAPYQSDASDPKRQSRLLTGCDLCRSLESRPPELRGGAWTYAIAEKTQGNTKANRDLTLSILPPEIGRIRY